MPLSEFLRMARGKLESGEPKQCSTNFSARPEDDLVELVWENGQVVMQGQSSRVARSPTQKVGHGARIGKFGAVESVSNDLSPVVPSGVDFSQDEEVAPWLSYPIDDTLAQDYASPLLPEISGVTASAQNSFVSVDKRSSCEQTVSNLDTMKASSSSSSKSHLLCSWPPQHRQASDVLRSTSNHRGKVFGNTAQGRATVNDCTSLKMGKQSTGQQPINNSNSLNFSHFSRPAALVKPNFPNSDAIPSSRMDVKDKNSSPVSGSNPVKSMRFNSTQKDIDLHVSSPTHAMVSSKQPVFKEITENLCRETSTKNDKPLIPSNTADSIKIVPDGERTIEPMVASSSVGSGNSADRVSCEQTHNSKRKFRDAEESECRSDDIETESFGVKRPTPARGGTGSKRSRAAEVHNLSERRRRDRINEKMRALQELIPNCNKADKASMLDEAIEYLKTLQLQVQIMSMGAGVCMPPMIFPTGMQRMHPAHLPHFSPMGMGMGFGMEMLNMNGGSSGCPIFPVPPMQLAHFPSPMTGPVNFQRIPGPNFPIYAHPGHGFVPRAPLVPLTGQPSMTSSSSLGNGSQNDVPSMSPIVTNTNSPLMRNAEAGSSINHKSNQIQATNAVLDQPAAVRDNKQATDAVGHAALTATTATDISKEPGYD